MDSNQVRAIEWDCQKLVQNYYQYVDRREYKLAVELFTPDVLWMVLGVKLQGREELLRGLKASLSNSTIRHIVSNCLVDVVDGCNANVTYYLSIYFTQNIKFESQDGPLHFDGPHRIMDQRDKLTLTEKGWQTAYRWGQPIFRRDQKHSIPLETWANAIANNK